MTRIAEQTAEQTKMTELVRPGKCKWAILIYMAADDANAINEARTFIKELKVIKKEIEKEIKKKPAVRILLQTYTDWDQSNRGVRFESRRYEINEDFSLRNPIQVPGFNTHIPMGDSAALTDFINWGKDECKADNYCLFLWGHGTGSGMYYLELEKSFHNIASYYDKIIIRELKTGKIIRDIKDLTDENSKYFKKKNELVIKISFKGTGSRRITENIIIKKRKTDFYDGQFKTIFDLLPEKKDGENLNPQTERLRKYLSSRSILDALLEQEIRKSLKNNTVNLVMIMGCCMQMVEFAYELRKSCEYLVASEELIYFNGYNYLDTFTTLFEYPDMNARELGQRLVQETPIKKEYNNYERHALAISCVDISKSEKLFEYIDKFSQAVMDIRYPEIWEIIKKAREKCKHFGEDAYLNSFIDVTWFFKKLQEQIYSDERFIELTDIVAIIIDHLEVKYIVQPWIGNTRTPSLERASSYGGHGVGMYFPKTKRAHEKNEDQRKPFERTEKEVNEFSRENNWNNLLFKYLEKNPG
jgi:hypothetical protein